MASNTVQVSIPDPSPKAETPSVKPVSLTKHVLVIACPDGHVEVYGDRGVRVHVAQRLDVERPDEVLADDYLTATLPAVFRDVYRADRCITCATIEPMTPEQELGRRVELALLHEIQEARKTPTITIDRQQGGRNGH
jgi:hypothetical protein